MDMNETRFADIKIEVESNKAQAIDFNHETVNSSSQKEIFADGLPKWDLVPPIETVRRNHNNER